MTNLGLGNLGDFEAKIKKKKKQRQKIFLPSVFATFKKISSKIPKFKLKDQRKLNETFKY